MSITSFDTLDSVSISIVDCPHSTPNWTASGKIVIRNFNIKNGFLNLSEKYYTDELTYRERIRRAKPEAGDLIITREAPMGEICMIPSMLDCCLGQRMVLIKPDPIKINNRYLLYAIQSEFVQKQINRSDKTGSIVSNLRIPDLENLLIPRLGNEFEKIAGEILAGIDTKIELNNRINAELESMAKTIYDYWFVQFDFPYDFALGRPDKNGKPYKSSGGKMVWNEELKREVPEGWGVKFMADWIEKDKSGDWGKESLEGNYTERVHCIRGADINGLNGKGEVKAPIRYILSKNSHKILEPFNLIIEISGGSPTQSTGRLAFLIDQTLSRFDAPVICSNFCKAVTLKYQKSIFNFVFEWNSAYNNGVLFGFEGKTSGIKNLLFESFINSYRTPIPPKKLMDEFFLSAHSLELKKQKLLQENKTLTELRDWLLPMLMNGQVRVK